MVGTVVKGSNLSVIRIASSTGAVAITEFTFTSNTGGSTLNI